MSRFLKIAVIVLISAALLPTGPVSSKGPAPKPTRTPRVTPTPIPQPTPTPTPTPPPPALSLEPNWVQPSLPANCTLGTDANGSQTLVCKPNVGFQLIGTVIIFAHGYVNPYFPEKTIPWDQLTFTDATGTYFLPSLVTDMGYYFATTSYRAHGLVVLDAIEDLLLVRAKAFSAMNALFKNAVLAGASEGGVVTALSIERQASSYYAGLAMCGPYGNFQKQVTYWGDFRALYDAYAIRPLPPSAVDIPGDLILDWYGDLGVSPLKVETANAVLAQYAKSTELLDKLVLMYDPQHQVYLPGDATTVRDTVLGLLDYNIFATNNGKQVLGGNPFNNWNTNYPLSQVLGQDLDNLVARYISTGIVSTAYETTGVLTKPLVLMHNQGDPIVPYWHLPEYQAKAAARGYSSNFLVQNQVSHYYGHCNFTQAELMAAFDLIGGFLLGAEVPSRENLLSGKALEDYHRIIDAVNAQRK